MPKVSIITINLNNSDGLNKTINSVINQSYKNFEYIIIDGGSSDGSLEVIKKYKDRIAYWESEPDTGIYNAMNKGIARANGEYILFLNSGDFLKTPEVISGFMELNSNEDIIYGNALFNEKGRFTLNKMSSDITFNFFFTSSFAHSSTFIKKELFNKVGCYNEKFRIVSDWEFFLKAIFIFKCTLKYLDFEISVVDCSGISRTNSRLRDEEKNIVLKELFPRFINDYNKLNHYIELNPRDTELSSQIQFLNNTKRFQILVKNITGLLITLYKLLRFRKYRTIKQQMHS